MTCADVFENDAGDRAGGRRNPCAASSRQASNSESNSRPDQLADVEQAALKRASADFRISSCVFSRIDTATMWLKDSPPEPSRRLRPVNQSWMLYVVLLIALVSHRPCRVARTRLHGWDQLATTAPASVYQRCIFRSKLPLISERSLLFDVDRRIAERQMMSISSPSRRVPSDRNGTYPGSRHGRIN